MKLSEGAVSHAPAIDVANPDSSVLSIELSGKARCAVGCDVCAEMKPFLMPTHLLRAFEDQKVLLFAGAGISTEGRLVFPYSLHRDIASELGKGADNLPFHELTSRYCQQPDGRSRLLLKIRERIEYVRSHPELHRSATRFHRELSTIWQIEEIVTTNWDTFFEEQCGATPFITDADLAFWSQPGRKVLKLHGSVHSLGEMVVTKTDHDACYDRLSSGLLGSHLKALLASRTVVFIGYSLGDPDLLRIISSLTAEMRGLRPTYYVVTPEDEAKPQFADVEAVHIRCAGTHFIVAVKQWLRQSRCSVPDSNFGRLRKVSAELSSAHRELYRRRPLYKYPETVHCASYQDGLHHALDRAATLAHTGKYSHRCRLRDMVDSYETIRRQKVKIRKYHDVAYIEGYTNGLTFLAADDDLARAIPLFYVHGATNQPRTFKDYERLANRSAKLNRAAYWQAQRLVKGMAKPGGDLRQLEFHHTPFLL